MSWRKVTFIIVALIVLLGGSAALSYLFISLKPEPPRRPDTLLKRSVKTETVRYSDLRSALSRDGRVTSSSEVVLVSEASGKIERGNVALRKGTSFRKGQLLAEIYKDEAELALKARKSRFLTTITTMLPDIKIDYPDHFNAYNDFFNSIDIDKQLPPLPANTNDKLKIFLASRNVLSEYYGILQDEKKLSRHSLYAPFNGTFTQVNFEVGGYVNTGGQIAKMIRTDELEVEVPVENEQSRWIKIGDKVNVYSKSGSRMREGTVIRKANYIDPNTQMRSVFVKVPSTPTDELLAGEYKRVEFPGQIIEDAMEITRSAVFNTNVVFTVVEDRLKKRVINIIKMNETSLVFNGLEEGEVVVVEPLINVKENSPVSIFGEEQKRSGGQGNRPASENKTTGEGNPQNRRN